MEKRIKLKIGKQKELIKLVKKKSELKWKDLAKRLNVSTSYLSGDLKYENALISEELYNKLCKLANVNFDKFIIKKLDKNWGQKKGGKLSTHKPRPSKILVNTPSIELAEIIGIFLGDGSVYINKNHGVNQTVISGHSEHDYEYLVNYVKPLLEKVFSLNFRIKPHRTLKSMSVINQNKNLVFTLKKFGFPPGNKVKNNVKIPEWIFRSTDYLKACIRGLIDTDGSVSPITGRNYPYIWFKSKTPSIRESFTKAMKILGFKIAKWTGKITPQTFIGKKELIYKYYKEIGFSNSWHQKRFNLLPSSSPVKDIDA